MKKEKHKLVLRVSDLEGMQEIIRIETEEKYNKIIENVEYIYSCF